MKLLIRDLSASYDTGDVLLGVDLEVRQGELVSLLGPSGCGKTTLMKAIAGIVPVRRGTVSVDGRDVTALPVHRRGTVIMFQDIRLFPHMTVEENVAFPLKMQAVPRAPRLELAREYLRKVQMAEYAGRRPGELSGGQQQRVALARALAARPRLLLLDEPFSSLDENLREEMRSLVLELKREYDMTAILVTHDREEALSLSDRVALMFDGRIAQLGTPREVFTRPASRQVADYFGGWVHIPGQVAGGVFRGGPVSAAAPVADGSWELLLRWEALTVDPTGDYPAAVEDIRYRGDSTHVRLRGRDGLLWEKRCSADLRWQTGQELNARICTEGGVYLPR